MTDLQSLIREAQRYGKLGAVVRWNKMASELSSRRGWNPQVAVAGDAIAEALALIVKQARMLREAAAQVASLTVDDVTWNELHVDEVLADLAADYEEAHDD